MARTLATTTISGPKPVPKPTIKPGLNRYTWDMHYPGFTEFKG